MTVTHPTSPKILPFEELAKRLAQRPQGQIVVHCHGDFEVLHAGNIRHLEEARSLGDVLVVSLTPDQQIHFLSERPVFKEDLRAEALAALSFVDFVTVNPLQGPAEAIRALKPDRYALYGPAEKVTRNHTAEEAAILEVGGKLTFTNPPLSEEIHTPVNPLSQYSPEVINYLQDFSSRYSASSILGWLQNARHLKVLVVGEAILDEYHYCETMGKSGKEPNLAARYLYSETFAGGILAVANNVSSFCDHVGVLTVLGRQNGSPDNSELFIRQHLSPKILPTFLYQDDAPTIVKRRFLECYPLQKLFEVYLLKHMEEEGPLVDELCQKLEEIVAGYDVVIVADYGHGMLGPRAVEILCRKARFLAVNTQTNADNQGFNTISKYPRADFICISEKEIRLEVRNRRKEPGPIMEEVARRMGCETLLVTRGQAGNLLFSPKDGFFTCPTLSYRVLDRVGAGDAVLSVTSLCVAQGAPTEAIGFIGNLVGAHAVTIVGNRSSLQLDSLEEHVLSILRDR
jgi:rfaE bifunctional protein kinase chain/domain